MRTLCQILENVCITTYYVCVLYHFDGYQSNCFTSSISMYLSRGTVFHEDDVSHFAVAIEEKFTLLNSFILPGYIGQIFS